MEVHPFPYLTPSLSLSPCFLAHIGTDAACTISGLGFNGYEAGDTKKENPKWDRCTNMHVLKVELAQNMKSVTDNWNIGTAKWLKVRSIRWATRLGVRGWD